MSERPSRWHLVMDLGSESLGPLVIARHDRLPGALYALALGDDERARLAHGHLPYEPEVVEGLRIRTEQPLRLKVYQDGRTLDCALPTVGGVYFGVPPLRAAEVAEACGIELVMDVDIHQFVTTTNALNREGKLRVA